MEITIEQLREAFPNTDNIRILLIQQIVNKWIASETLESFKSNEQWIKQCFNRPSDQELAMNALNEILEGHGVESINLEGAYINRYWDNCIATYINMGDTYSMTIVFDTMNQSYHLTSWGDFYEHAETIEDYFA